MDPLRIIAAATVVTAVATIAYVFVATGQLKAIARQRTPVTHSLRQHRPKPTRALSSRLNEPVRSP